MIAPGVQATSGRPPWATQPAVCVCTPKCGEVLEGVLPRVAFPAGVPVEEAVPLHAQSASDTATITTNNSRYFFKAPSFFLARACTPGRYSITTSLQDVLYPALVATGHRRPRPKALGQFAPGRARARHPEHRFHDQAMVASWTARLRLRRRHERTELLPVLISEGRQPRHRRGSGYLRCHRGSLPCPPQDMKAPRLCLMLASQVRPRQSVGPLLRRLCQRLEQTTHLRHRQCEPVIGICPFFPARGLALASPPERHTPAGRG